MDKTRLKKIVGTVGAAVSSTSIWLLANQRELADLFPRYGHDIMFVTAIVGLMASWWGKHPGSSHSVDDVKDASI